MTTFAILINPRGLVRGDTDIVVASGDCAAFPRPQRCAAVAVSYDCFGTPSRSQDRREKSKMPPRVAKVGTVANVTNLMIGLSSRMSWTACRA